VGTERSLVREARIRLGVSVEELGRLLRAPATAVADLEFDESAGTVDTARARRALDLMDQIEQVARRIARSVETTMALEGQGVSAAVLSELFERALRNEIAKF